MGAPTLDTVDEMERILFGLSKLIRWSKPFMYGHGSGAIVLGGFKKTKIIKVYGTASRIYPGVGNKKIIVEFIDKKYKTAPILNALLKEKAIVHKKGIELIVN